MTLLHQRFDAILEDCSGWLRSACNAGPCGSQTLGIGMSDIRELMDGMLGQRSRTRQAAHAAANQHADARLVQRSMAIRVCCLFQARVLQGLRTMGHASD